MRWITIALRRLRAFIRRADLERDMSDELRLHLELEARHREQRGLDPADAKRAALLTFGGMDAVKEAYRDARGVRPLDDLAQDVRYGLRSLRASPAFTLAVVLTLALGIGANTAIFSVVHGVLLRALPYADADRIAVVWETDRDSGTDREDASVPDYFDFVARSRAFAALAAVVDGPLNRTSTGGEPERITGARVTANIFAALGVTPRLGRGFLASDDVPGGAHVAIVSDRYWRTRLGGIAGVLGQTLRLDDSSYTIIGVLPPDVRFPSAETDVWAPMQLTATSGPRSRHFIHVVGRLRPGVTMAAASAEMGAIAGRLESEYPRDNKARGTNVESLTDVMVGGVRKTLVLMLGAVGLVLLIACANAASLLLARLASRSREVAVRAALGATRRRLAQQFFVESLMLTLGASALGVLIARGGLSLLLSLAPPGLPRREQIALDWPVLAATLAVSVVVAMAFGLLPALTGGGAPGESLQGSNRGGTASREHRRFRGGLVVAEVALSLVLAIAAGLLVKSFTRVRAVDPGFKAEHLLTLRYQLPSSRYPQSFSNFPAGWSKIFGFQRDVLGRVGALPGVRSVALAANDPLASGFTNGFVIEGREQQSAKGQAEMATRPVSADYFATAGIPLLRGRGYLPTDDASAPNVLIINEAAAKQYWADQNPIGHRLRFWGTWREIVGVVGNERFAGLTAPAAPAMYPVMTQTPMSTASLLVRTAGDPHAVLASVRRELREVDPGVAPFGVQTMEEALSDAMGQQRFTATLLGGFAAVALVLALVGIYGVVSYSVAQRTREIGIRVALGATTRNVIGDVLGQGLKLAIAGSALGVIGALGAGRLLGSQLFGVTPTDPVTFVVSVAAILAVAIIGSYLPARRAATVQAIVALRTD